MTFCFFILCGMPCCMGICWFSCGECWLCLRPPYRRSIIGHLSCMASLLMSTVEKRSATFEKMEHDFFQKVNA